MSKNTQLLEVNPPTELHFQGPFTQVVSSGLTLNNPSDKHVCFKIKTTAPMQYCVRPNSGILQAKQNIAVQVMLQPFGFYPSEKNTHKFMVQSTVVADPMADPETVFKNTNPSDLMFTKLECVFDWPAGAPVQMASTSTGTAYPNNKPLKVRLVAKGSPRDFTSSEGEIKQFLQLGLASQERAFKAFHYDPNRISHIKEGNYLILKNFLCRQDGNITMNSNTLAYHTAPFELPKEFTDAAYQLINPSEATLITIKEASQSPVKRSVSIKGCVTQDEIPRHVSVGGNMTSVRSLTLEDTSGKIRVSLWEHLSEQVLQLGDYVHMTNLSITKFNNETTAGTTMRTNIQILEPAVTPKTIEVEGIMPYDSGFQVISTSDGTFNISPDLLQQHLHIEEDDLLEELSTFFPWTIDVNLRGMEIVSFQSK